MSESYIKNLEAEISLIIRSLPDGEGAEPSVLECTVDGCCSGIPGALGEALTRYDETFFTNERFHALIPEVAYIVSREKGIVVRIVRMHIGEGDVRFEYE